MYIAKIVFGPETSDDPGVQNNDEVPKRFSRRGNFDIDYYFCRITAVKPSTLFRERPRQTESDV